MEGFIDSILDRLLATSVQTAVLVAIVWLLCRLLPRLSPATQCWLWWLVALQVLLGLFMAPLPLKWLPPESAMGSLGTSIGESNQFSALVAGAEPSVTAGTGGSWKGGIFLLWVSGLLVMTWSLLRDWRRTRSLLQGSTDCTDESRPRIVTAAADASRLRAAPRLRMSDQIESPMVIGHFRPRLLLPAHARLSEEELRMAVAHELEHLRRADLWWESSRSWPGTVSSSIRCCTWRHASTTLRARRRVTRRWSEMAKARAVSTVSCCCDLALRRVRARGLPPPLRRSGRSAEG